MSATLLVTQGFGQPTTGSDTLPISLGFGGPVTPTGGAFQTIGLIPGYLTIELDMTNTPTIAGPAADPAQYLLLPLDGGVAATVTALTISLNTLFLTTTEHTNGKLYQLRIPTIGLVDVDHNVYQGPFIINYTGVGVQPTALQARSIDARLVEVIFDKPMGPTALIASNYTIDNGLKVSKAVRVTDKIYRLTTTRQVQGLLYTVFANGLYDIYGNLI